MPTINEVARQFGPRYVALFGANMLPSHRRTLADLAGCRTPEFGGQLYRCDHCHEMHYAYLSCRNRHCSTCSGADREEWLKKRRTEMLPVPYFHVVFTVPKCLRKVFRQNQKIAYGVLMKAAAQSLLELAEDKQNLGAQSGIMAILHTWTRALIYHPHVHCLVPSGGISKSGMWKSPRNPKFLVPVKALSVLFRGKLMAMLKKTLPGVWIPATAWNQKWVVYSKPPMHNPDMTLQYLGRYVNRIAITNTRIVGMDEKTVTFRYKESKGPWRSMTLTGIEFLRRFLQHVLPTRFCKIRYYGFWHPSNRSRLKFAQLLLYFFLYLAVPESDKLETKKTEAKPPRTCPRCGSAEFHAIRSMASQRAPPWRESLRYSHCS